MVDRRPAAILRCTSAEDVVAGVRFARESDLEIAVKCGGHSVLGLSVPNGGVMIDLTPINDVRVDPDAFVYTVSTGVTRRINVTPGVPTYGNGWLVDIAVPSIRELRDSE